MSEQPKDMSEARNVTFYHGPINHGLATLRYR